MLHTVDGSASIMDVTVTELRKNLDRYLEKVSEEDVLIAQGGHVIARLTAAVDERRLLRDELVGCLDTTMTIEDAKAKRAASL